ncbi:hypothetical protein MTO96_018742 [Rhipicephalus appendiculatus]
MRERRRERERTCGAPRSRPAYGTCKTSSIRPCREPTWGRASSAVHLLHRSCVRFLLDPSTTPEVIWAEMVDVLRSFSTSPNQLDPLLLVGLLDIRYNVEVLLRSSVTSPWSRNLTLKLKPVIPNVPLLSDSPRTNRELLGRLLSFLRSSLNVSATAEGLRRLASVVASKDSPENSTAEEEEVTGRIFLLNEYMSKATFKVWVASLKAVCACDNVVYAEVKIYDAKLFAAQVDVCADTEYRDDLLSYIMAAASANLFQKSLVASAGQDSPTRLDTCTSWVLDMRHIWDMVAIERHADAAKDKVLRSLFDATVRTAAKDVETLFSTSVEGAASLRHFLSRLVLLHPKKVNDLYAYLLPNFESGQHVRNRFAVREFSVRTLAMDAALDLSDKRSLRAGSLWPARDYIEAVRLLLAVHLLRDADGLRARQQQLPQRPPRRSPRRQSRPEDPRRSRQRSFQGPSGSGESGMLRRR